MKNKQQLQVSKQKNQENNNNQNIQRKQEKELFNLQEEYKQIKIKFDNIILIINEQYVNLIQLQQNQIENDPLIKLQNIFLYYHNQLEDLLNKNKILQDHNNDLQIEIDYTKIQTKFEDSFYSKEPDTFLQTKFEPNKSMAREKRWKDLYLKETQKYLKSQDNLKQISEESKITQNQLILLENKVQKYEKKINQLQLDLYQKKTEERMENINIILKNIESLSEQQEHEIKTINAKNKILEIEVEEGVLQKKDLLDQISVLVNQKEELQRNLVMSRIEVTQLFEKLSDEVSKIITIEKSRIVDIEYIVKLEKQLDIQ